MSICVLVSQKNSPFVFIHLAYSSLQDIEMYVEYIELLFQMEYIFEKLLNIKIDSKGHVSIAQVLREQRMGDRHATCQFTLD
jgi:hypothetical protein